jgi:hypothetical protein
LKSSINSYRNFFIFFINGLDQRKTFILFFFLINLLFYFCFYFLSSKDTRFK